MDFNINKFLVDKITENKDAPGYILWEILQKYDKNFSKGNLSFSKGNLSFKNISPGLKLHIKMNKQEIIDSAKRRGVTIRDII